jgi:FKBP-type peptidyl-prolyl cis-trans isomerase
MNSNHSVKNATSGFGQSIIARFALSLALVFQMEAVLAQATSTVGADKKAPPIPLGKPAIGPAPAPVAAKEPTPDVKPAMPLAKTDIPSNTTSIRPASAALVSSKILSTPSGVRYEDIVVGKGAVARAGQTVTVHYTGWLLKDGKLGNQFDSSLGRSEPFKFSLGGGRVIKGWDEGIAGMQVGGKRILTVPPEAGYGAKAVGTIIPAGSTLVFEVQLIGV